MKHTTSFDSNICYRDRRKLTFYFIAEKRIDFRELVRELFRQVPAHWDSSLPIYIYCA